jgi:peroxiredoxin
MRDETQALLKSGRLVLLWGFAALVLPAWAAVEVGKDAPNFSGVDSNGKTHALSQYKGKTVVLEWTNHDCPYVGKHYKSGNMQQLQKDATAKGIVWLSIISSAPGTQGHVSGAAANNLTRTRNAVPSAVILDERGDIGRMYGAKVTPHMYIVNPAGQLVYMGGIDSIPTTDEADIAKATKYVTLALQAMADGKPIAQNVTRPYGCSVKY